MLRRKRVDLPAVRVRLPFPSVRGARRRLAPPRTRRAAVLPVPLPWASVVEKAFHGEDVRDELGVAGEGHDGPAPGGGGWEKRDAVRDIASSRGEMGGVIRRRREEHGGASARLLFGARETRRLGGPVPAAPRRRDRRATPLGPPREARPRSPRRAGPRGAARQCARRRGSRSATTRSAPRRPPRERAREKTREKSRLQRIPRDRRAREGDRDRDAIEAHRMHRGRVLHSKGLSSARTPPTIVVS